MSGSLFTQSTSCPYRPVRVAAAANQAAHRLGRGLLCRRGLVSRIVAAAFGGYALAALFSIAALTLPFARAEAALWGMQLAFLVYAGAVVWVFAVRSATRAWVGLLVVGLGLLPFAWWVWSGRAGAVVAVLGAHAVSGGIAA